MTIHARGYVACLLSLFLLGGCASTGQKTEDATRRQLRETEHRLKTLEAQLVSLNGQMAQLDTRVYEVRNRSGRKTGMTAVPASPLTTAGPAASSSASASASSPKKRADNAAARPGKADTQAQQARQGGKNTQTASGPSGQIGRPEPTAGPSGQLAVRKDVATAPPPPEALALPPVEAPGHAPAVVPLPVANSAPTGPVGRDVPVPDMQSLGLALPPEQGMPVAASQMQGSAASLPPALPPSQLPGQGSGQAVGQASGQASGQISGQASGQPTGQAVSPGNAPAQGQGKPRAAVSPRAEEAAYKRALNHTLAGRANNGMVSFQEFLQEYPQGRYAPNAHYWIGESLYAQGRFSEALAQFQRVATDYPKHHKSADALLKAGMSLSRMGDKQGAAAQYKLLLERFPQSEAARLARARGLARQ